MEELDINIILDFYHRKLNGVKTKFHRYLYDRINWESRLIGLEGPRGVGKTTMLLQYINETFPSIDNTLYATLDHMWFSTHTLYELAEYADSHGITHLFLDEVHRYKNWATEIKMIYDSMPELHIVYTGSSILEIERSKADLSRRQTLYHMQGMSFREYLLLEAGLDFSPVTLADILTDHVRVAMEITRDVKILPYFEKYLREGYYPFRKDAGNDFLLRLSDVVNTIIDIDIPAVAEVTFATMQKARKLMMTISSSVPFTPDLESLFKSIETTRDSGLRLLNILAATDLLQLLSSKQRNYKNLVIPEKIFLDNTNLMFALTDHADTGAIRETMFLNQMRQSHNIEMPKRGDFLIDGRYLFEVGGKSKTYNQIADIPDSYLAVDNTEVGHGHRIPLWLFGMMY